MSQSPRDRILWILINSGGKMERSRLRRCAGMKLADLNLILGEQRYPPEVEHEYHFWPDEASRRH